MAVKTKVSLITLSVRDVSRVTAFHERLGWTAASEQGEVEFFNLGAWFLGCSGGMISQMTQVYQRLMAQVFGGRAWPTTSQILKISIESPRNSLRQEQLL